MSVFKCKMCGGNLTVNADEKVVECEFCGSRQTVACADDEKKINLFNRANRLRIACEFDKAAGVYESIIAEFPEEAEAYWGLCLSTYGIEYVDDPLTGKKIPTCHRATLEKMRKDENYGMALENADSSARIVYEEQAKEIDRVMSDIIAVSHDEKPYDIFICYKETDNSGERTPDSVLAQDIYDALTAKGYRVFFSRISLEDKLGAMYEPYIFAALHSAKIMLAVGTDFGYFNAVWVRNEWSRFIKLMGKDKSRILIPCYKDMSPYDMPDEFRGFQSQDCSRLGFMQDLTHCIDKILKNGDAASADIRASGTADNSVSVEKLLERVFIFLGDGKWQDANIYCEKVLDADPKNAEAYLGKLMVEFHVKSRQELASCESPFDTSDNYAKIIRFGNEALENEIRGYLAQVIQRNDQKHFFEKYEYARIIMQGAQSEQTYRDSANMFRSLSGYKDSDAMAVKCIEKAEAMRLMASANKEKEQDEENERNRQRERKEKRLRIILIGITAVSVLIALACILIRIPG